MSLEVIVSVLLVVLTVIGTYLANAHFQRKFALVERLWDEKFKGLTRIFETLSDIGDIIVEVGSIQTTVEKMAKTPIEKIQLLNLECLSISKRHSIPIDELPTIDPLTSGIADESLIAETKSKMMIKLLFKAQDYSFSFLSETSDITLILYDQSILLDAAAINQHMLDTMHKAASEPLDPNKEADTIHIMMKKLREKSITELNRTKLSKFPWFK